MDEAAWMEDLCRGLCKNKGIDPEQQHGGKAVFVESVPVVETFNGKTVWDGRVVVFDLDGCRNATRAYAWSSPIEGSTKRRFFAVLHLGGIRSPQDAVRAAIVAETLNGGR